MRGSGRGWYDKNWGRGGVQVGRSERPVRNRARKNKHVAVIQGAPKKLTPSRRPVILAILVEIAGNFLRMYRNRVTQLSHLTP